jgi:hypothetical protein
MSDPSFATPIKLNEFCGRAVEYRRHQLAELGADPIALRSNVRFSVPFRDLNRHWNHVIISLAPGSEKLHWMIWRLCLSWL